MSVGVGWLYGLPAAQTPETVLEQLPGTAVRPERGDVYLVRVNMGGSFGVLVSRRVAPSFTIAGFLAVGGAGAWGIWAMHALGWISDGSLDPDWRVATRSFRLLRRFVLSAANTNANGRHFVAGPWSYKALKRAFPGASANNIVHVMGNTSTAVRAPWVLAGQEPEAIGAVDYDPTDGECNADTETTATALFG